MALGKLPRPRALWLQLRNVPILRMLQLEEALFRTDRRSWFITNEWDSAQPAAEALVLGISGRPEQMLHVEAAQRSGIPVIKRFTGGGTVVVDSDTLFASFIVAEGALPDVKPYPEPMLAWSGAQPLARTTPGPHRPPSPHRPRVFYPPHHADLTVHHALTGELYADALQRCGVNNFAVRANDYCLHADDVDLKFGGNAQSISGKRWLHARHGQGRRPGSGRTGGLRLHFAPACGSRASRLLGRAWAAWAWQCSLQRPKQAGRRRCLPTTQAPHVIAVGLHAGTHGAAAAAREAARVPPPPPARELRAGAQRLVTVPRRLRPRAGRGGGRALQARAGPARGGSACARGEAPERDLPGRPCGDYGGALWRR